MTDTPETRLWVKVPGPGQYRGEGEWTPWEEVNLWLQARIARHGAGFLPIHHGESPPEEDDHAAD